MRTIIIDNYDSFTYNLYHLLRTIGVETDVVRNDKFELPLLNGYDKILLSPGPGIPEESGLLLDVIKEYAGKKPILGICLGHQAIGQHFGGKLTNLDKVFHGVSSQVDLKGNDYLFEGLGNSIEVGRYHSWVVDNQGLPDCLEVTATSTEGQIMAIRHKSLDIRGIQFHPESVLTPEGKTIINNWIRH